MLCPVAPRGYRCSKALPPVRGDFRWPRSAVGHLRGGLASHSRRTTRRLAPRWKALDEHHPPAHRGCRCSSILKAVRAVLCEKRHCWHLHRLRRPLTAAKAGVRACQEVRRPSIDAPERSRTVGGAVAGVALVALACGARIGRNPADRARP